VSALSGAYTTEMNAPSRPWVAIFLAIANVAVFVWEVSAGADLMRPTAPWMLAHGGNYGPVTFDGEQWRLFTSMFLHYGVLHIAMNMLGLLDGGRHVERMYGHAGFVALYVVSGLAGSLASGIRGQAVSAGASGAIFGIFGAFGAFLLLHRGRLDRETVSRQARGLMIFLAYNVYFGLAAKGIDLVAHLGGLAAGFVCGLALEAGTDEKPSTAARSALVLVLGSALVVGASFAAPHPRNARMELAKVEHEVITRWNELITDAKAMRIDDSKFADAIDNELLPAWRKAHAAFLDDADAPARAELLHYIEEREEAMVQIVDGVRTNNPTQTRIGFERFAAAAQKVP